MIYILQMKARDVPNIMNFFDFFAISYVYRIRILAIPVRCIKMHEVNKKVYIFFDLIPSNNIICQGTSTLMIKWLNMSNICIYIRKTSCTILLLSNLPH